MILLQKGQSNEIVVTLAEKGSLTTGWYRFLFANKMTQEEVEVTFSFSDDTSPYPEKYNCFQITTSAHFTDAAKPGMWSYRVWEQDDDTTPVIQNLVETGIMRLLPAAEFEISQFQGETTTYKTFNAE
jgi:hypothetical protein